MFILYYLVVLLSYCINMCLHPVNGYNVLDRPIEIAKYHHELDNCDYFERTDPIDVNHGDLLVMQLNIQGLSNKISSLQDLVNSACRDKRVDLILLCETWQNKNSPTISLPGYNYVHKYRKHKTGGGVGIFVNDRIQFTDVKTEILYECIEHVVVNITTKNDKRPITIGSLYRVPNTNDSKFVEEYNCLLKELYKKSKSKKLILGMDHNLDFLKHSTHKRTHDFIELNLDNNLLPTITRPTRITKMTVTLIDNIIVSHSLMVNSESRIIIDDISDHLPSLLKLKDTLQNDRYTKTVTSRKLNDKTLKKLNNTLTSQNWASVITENVDESFNSFHKILQDTLDLHAPVVTRKLSPKSYRRERWLNPSLLRCINRQKKLYLKTLKSNASNYEFTKYKNYKKILDKLKRRVKIRYFHTKCSEYKGNVRKMWDLINQVIGKTSDETNVISSIKVDLDLDWF